MLQMKEQDKKVQDQLYDEETCNLPEKEFIAMILKLIQYAEKRMEA